MVMQYNSPIDVTVEGIMTDFSCEVTNFPLPSLMAIMLEPITVKPDTKMTSLREPQALKALDPTF